MTRMLKLITLVSIAFLIETSARSIPENMRIYPDSSMIKLNYVPEDGLYNFNSVDTIYLSFNQPNWWQLLTNNYKSKLDIEATLRYKGITYEGVGVRFRGNTSYQKVQNSQKKSFNISMDFINQNQNIEGYKTLNLNNGYEDPTIMREVLYSRLAGQNAPIARSNFIKLVINGENWGLYSNVQQLNDEFYDDWFMSSDGTSWRAEYPDTSTKKPKPPNPSFGTGVCTLNYLSDEPIVYSSYYTLKSTSRNDPWFDLMLACKMLNTIPSENLYDSLKNYIDIDRSLWHLANEIVFADDDGYITKGGMDYYVYYDIETGRLQPVEFDGNNTFLTKNNMMNLFFRETDDKFPLMNKLMLNKDLKQRFVAHVRYILTEVNTPEKTTSLIDEFQLLIDGEVQTDTKKLMSWDAYLNGIELLKNNLNLRREYLKNHYELKAIPPIISEVTYFCPGGERVPPKSEDNVIVMAKVISQSGLSRVRLYYGSGLMGVFNSIDMYDDGNHYDLDSNDGYFAASIPSSDAGTYVRFYIEANGNNLQKSAAYNPPGAEHDVYYYQVTTETSAEKKIVINEIMASNSATIADPQGEFDDWIELYNLSGHDFDLSGCYLTDKLDNFKKWQFPSGTIIKNDDYLIVWADENGKATPGLHANFKLSVDGELVMLIDNDANGNRILDSISFGLQKTDISFGRSPNGTGQFRFLEPTPLERNDRGASISSSKGDKFTISVFPNPASTHTNILIEDIAGGFYTIEIFSTIGEKLTRIETYDSSDGKPIIGWDCRDDLGHEVVPGVYIVKVSNGTELITKKLIIAR
jgi:hypothetical protein